MPKAGHNLVTINAKSWAQSHKISMPNTGHYLINSFAKQGRITSLTVVKVEYIPFKMYGQFTIQHNLSRLLWDLPLYLLQTDQAST